MKKNNFPVWVTFLTVLTVFAVLTVSIAGCQNPVIIHRGANAKSTVTVRLASDEARTVLPADPVFAKYSLSFTAKDSQAPVADMNDISPAAFSGGVKVQLAPGNWTITATGFVDTSGIEGMADDFTAAARGSKDVSLVSDTAYQNVDIAINYITQGTGVLDYTVDLKLPAYATAASFKVLDLNGAPLDPPVEIDVMDAASGTLNLPAGYYIFQVRVAGADNDVSVKSDILHIYPGLDTTVNVDDTLSIIKNDTVFVTFDRNLGYFPAETDPYAQLVEPVNINTAFLSPDIRRPGFAFSGWYANAAGTGDEVTALTADSTVYAKWTWSGPSKIVYQVNDDGTAFTGTPYDSTGTAGTPFDATVHNVGFLTENSMNLLQIRNGGYIDLGSIAGAAFNGGSFNDGTNPAGVGWTIEITFLQPDTTNYDLLSFYRGPLQTKDANALWAESYSGIIRHSPGTTNASTSNTHNISGKWIDVIYVCSGSWIDPWLNGVKDSGNAGNFAALQSGDYAPFLHNYIGNGMTDGKIYRVIITADRRGMDGSGTIKSTEKTEILNTLTALNTAVVTYDPNGGYWVSDSSTDPLVQNTTLTSQYSASIPAEPKKDGEVFMGWNTQADGTGDWIVPGALITAWNSAFYAIWSDVAYVYFIDGPDSYKGTQLTPMDTETVTIGETLAALPDAPVLAGYDFAGWWTQQVGGTEVTTDTIVDRVIYAYSHWTLKPEVKELVFELNSSNVLTGTYYDATDGAGNAIGTVTPIITGTPAIDTIHGDLRSLVLGNGSYIDLGREAAMMINQPFWTVNMYARIPAAEPVTDHLMTVMQNTGDLTKGVMWSEANNSAYGFAYRDRTNWSDSSTTSPAYSGSPGNAQTGNFVSLSYMRDGSGWAHDVLNATTQGDWGQSGSNLAESANCNPMNYFFLGRMPDGAVTTAAVEYYKIILRPEFPGPDQATYLAQYGDSITNTVNTLNFYPFVDAVTANVNNMNLSAINGNLSLPTSYNGITISWVSEHPEYLSNTGVVTQPEGLGDQTFNITATFTAGSLTEQSIFSVTVLDAAPIIVTSKLIDDFEVPGASIGSNATSYGYNYWQNNGSGGFTFDAGYTGSLCGKITYANSWTWWQGGRDFQSAPIDISGCTKITFWARCANSSLGGDGVHLMSGTSSSGRPEKIWDIPNGMTDTWQKYEFPLTDLPDGFDLTKITGWSIRNWDQVTFYVDDIYAE